MPTLPSIVANKMTASGKSEMFTRDQPPAFRAAGARAFFYTHNSGHQSQKGRENIPIIADTNHRRGERIYP